MGYYLTGGGGHAVRAPTALCIRQNIGTNINGKETTIKLWKTTNSRT